MRPENERNPGIFSKIYADVDSGIFNAVSGLRLPENPLVRKILKETLRGIEIRSIPESLAGGAVLASNYPDIKETLRAVLKVGCLLPGPELRLLAIAREDIVTRTSPFLGGFLKEAVLPARKDEEGRYSLVPSYAAKALNHLKKGGVLWLSVTGSTEGNGLKKEHVRHGAVALAQKAQVPIVPMGIITNEAKKVIQVRFGQAMIPSSPEEISDFNIDEYRHSFSLLVMEAIAELLPPGQKGDFENSLDTPR